MLSEVIIHGRIKHVSIKPVISCRPYFTNQYCICLFGLNCLSECSPEIIIYLICDIESPAVYIKFSNPVSSYIAEVFCCFRVCHIKFRHHTLITKAVIIGIFFRIVRSDNRKLKSVEPVYILGSLPFSYHIFKRLEFPATVIENAIYDHSDIMPVIFLY